jgi:PPOX class probable F420-dependent enzyme
MMEIPERARELLASPQIAFLATVRPDGDIAIAPVSPMCTGGDVWVSARSDTRKVSNLRHDPRATLCVVDQDKPQRYALFRGHATVTPDPDRAKLNELARFYMGVDEYPYDAPGAERVVITIHPHAVVTPRVHGS